MNHFLCWEGRTHWGELDCAGGTEETGFHLQSALFARYSCIYHREKFCLLARKIFGEILKVNAVDKQIGK